MNLPKNEPLSVPNQLLESNKYEIWSNGQMINGGETNAQLWVEQENPEFPNNGIKMTIRIFDDSKAVIHKYIKERFYFDVAFAIKDRIIVAILPQESNIKNNNSYSTFMNFAPFSTRDYYFFENEIPYACSLFYDENDKLIKVTYTNGMNNTFIEFTK